ncbi:universal stress protein [Halobellus sp. GM3]|uniref:universal stress protein n=1 Tax=Halobellus sp. GM3 TaxID=3458410 RepID=UPI00403D7238
MYYALLAIDSNKERAEEIVSSVMSLPRDPTDLKVIILNVFEEFEVTDEGGTISSDEVYAKQEIPESVEMAVRELDNYGAQTEVRREHGDPKEIILSVSKNKDVDSIFMCGRKRTPTGKVLFGSVTQAILLNATRPVVVTTI